MVLTRGREAAERALYEGCSGGDALAVERACQQLPASPDLGGLPALHWAAALDAVGVLPALAALAARRGAGGLDTPLPPLDGAAWPFWLHGLWLGLRAAQRDALMVPGCTPLAVAAR